MKSLNDKIFESGHRIDEMSTISRPNDNIPDSTKIKVYGESDEQGTKTPHFHVEIDNGSIILEVEFRHINNLIIWRTKGNYPKTWNNHVNIKNRILDWLYEKNKKNFNLTNLQRMIIAWNDENPNNEINIEYTQ